MKSEIALMIILIVCVLVLGGVSIVQTERILQLSRRVEDTEHSHYNDLSEDLNTLADAQPTNKLIILAWHEKINVTWHGESMNVCSYEVGYLYYSTEAGSDNAMLYIGFPGDLGKINLWPGELYSKVELQIGAPAKGVFRFDIQSPWMYIGLYSMSTMEYDWIQTSLSVYLVG